MGRRAALALTGGLLLAATGTHATVSEEVVDRTAWEPPATIEEAAARPALHRTVAAFLGDASRWVRIAHAGGARGSAWASDIRAWLIALGIPGSRIQIDPGMAERAHLRLAIHEEGERL